MRVVQKIVCAALIGVTLSAGSTATLGAQTGRGARDGRTRTEGARAAAGRRRLRLPRLRGRSWNCHALRLRVRGSLKTEAVQAVKRVRGVDDVVDRIEFLPSSPQDESIRLATLASVYGDDYFSRYISGGPVTVRYDFDLFTRFPNMQPVGMYPIHIIVKNLRTTLLGTVIPTLIGRSRQPAHARCPAC